jgi:electron transport complex protein RnfG
MKSSLKNMVLVLFSITFISAACVGAVNMITQKPIAEAKEAAVREALSQVLPEFDATEKSEQEADGLVIVVHKATKGEEVVGYAIESATKSGFSGLVRLMVGFDTKGTILNVNVLQQAETPGLGAKMTEEGNPLLASVKGKEASKINLTVKKDGGDVDALTAATISSRAYAEAVARAYAVFKVAAGWQKDVQATTGASKTNGGEDSDHGNFEPKRGKE